MFRCALILLFACTPILTGFSQEAPAKTSVIRGLDGLGEKSHSATYEVDFQVVVTGPAHTKKLQVWLPLPPSDAYQTIAERQLTTMPRAVQPRIESEPEFGNEFAYFEFLNPDGAQLIRHRFVATLHQVNWNVNYQQVRQVDQWPEDYRVYLKPDPRSEQADQLKSVLDEINRSDSSSQRLLNAIDWVDSNLTYDHAVASLSANPLHALTHRRGHCSDYHGLCGTLARNVGYPSRVLYGLQMFDKGSPSHCKLDVLLPPYGWVKFDLSETQKLVKKISADDSKDETTRQALVAQVKDRTLSGFQENTWLQVTRGVNYQLAPPASQRVSIVRTIYAEADGKPLSEPDSSNAEQERFSWMTIHRVDEVGEASRRFGELDAIAKQ